MLENNKNWPEVVSEPTEIHHDRQDKGSTSTMGASIKSVVILQGNYKNKNKTMRAAAVSIVSLTAAMAQTTQNRKHKEEDELPQQGYRTDEIKAVQNWLYWLGKQDYECEPLIKSNLSESESGPELSIIAQRAIAVVAAGEVI